MQLLALPFNEILRICGRLNGITQIRESHEPERVVQIVLTPNSEGGPAGIRYPMMLFRLPFIQQCVAQRAGKRNVDDPTGMYVSDFGGPKPEFAPAKNGASELTLRATPKAAARFRLRSHFRRSCNYPFRCVWVTVGFCGSSKEIGRLEWRT